MDDFMAAYPNAGGICINWLIFGSSHHETRPTGGVLENFTMCAEKNFYNNGYTKFIGDPAKIFAANIHSSMCCKGFMCLDENGKIITEIPTRNISFDKIRVNHYFCKSKEEFITKRNRGKADRFDIRPMNEFDHHDRNELIDTEILSRR